MKFTCGLIKHQSVKTYGDWKYNYEFLTMVLTYLRERAGGIYLIGFVGFKLHVLTKVLHPVHKYVWCDFS